MRYQRSIMMRSLSRLGCLGICALNVALLGCKDDGLEASPPTAFADAASEDAASDTTPSQDGQTSEGGEDVLGEEADLDAALEAADSPAETATDSGPETCNSGPLDTTFSQKLQSVLTTQVSSAKLLGAVAAVLIPCQGVWVGASGTSNPQTSSPLVSSGLLRIASVTKTYTAAVIHLLVEDGKLSLDDSLETHVAGIPAGNTITVRMLLNHTSGLFDFVDDTAYETASADNTHVFTPAQLVAYGTANAPYFAPGQGWHYSNTNYVLLGMIAEKLGGTTIGQQYHSRLLSPVGLTHTYFDGEDTYPTADLIPGYEEVTAGQYEARTNALHPSASWAAGAMVATVEEVVRWGDALFSGAVLKKASLDEMVKCVETGEEGQGWGAGAACLTTPLGVLWGHGGGISGYSSVLLYDSTRKASLAVIANQQDAAIDSLVQGLLMEIAMH